MKSVNAAPKTFSAPLGQLQRGHLFFPNGVAPKVHIRANPNPELFQARFDYPVPEVAVQEGRVSLHYHYIPVIQGLLRLERPAEIALNSSIRWRIEVARGTAEVTADLSGLWVEALLFEQGVAGLRLELPKPSGIVPIRLAGGVATAKLWVPVGVAVGVLISGGAANLNLDGNRLVAVGGETGWESPGFVSATDRYEIEVPGGAAQLSLERYSGSAV